MCGRYRRTTREEELARIYHVPIPAQPDLPISYNIAPNQPVLAIRFNPETKHAFAISGESVNRNA
jgi:putative SOS response-associated peptidase YedK